MVVTMNFPFILKNTPPTKLKISMKVMMVFPFHTWDMTHTINIH